MWPHAFSPLYDNAGPGEITWALPLVLSCDSMTAVKGQLPGATNGDAANNVIRIENLTDGWAYCHFGEGSVPNASANNGIGVPPNWTQMVKIRGTTNKVSVILSTGTGTVRFLRGDGIT